MKKISRALSIIALVFIGVFTVTLVISFFGIGGLPILIITIISFVIALILFAIIKFALKDKKPPIQPIQPESHAEDGAATNSTTNQKPEKTFNENGVEYLD